MLTLCLVVSLTMLGCRAAQRKPQSLRTPTPTRPSPRDTAPRATPTPMAPSGTLPTDRQEVVQLQDKLAKEAEAVPGVSRSWVVLSGSTAMVGTELKEDIPRGSQGDAAGVKNEVMTRLRRAEPRLTGVAVATDAGTVNQLRKVAEGMRTGKQTTTFSRDVNKLSLKLMPGAK
jgi:YhcN/YlaJ family sporulation lipoprotein